MGSRGPLQQTDSRRGGATAVGRQFDAPEAPEAPGWLAPNARDLFEELVEDLVAARIPIKRIDGHAIAMAAQSMTDAQTWRERESSPEIAADYKARTDAGKLAARYQRDSQQWLAVICATPQSRARMGLGAAPKKLGKMARILLAKNAVNGAAE